jgi:hypothetical protein
VSHEWKQYGGDGSPNSHVWHCRKCSAVFGGDRPADDAPAPGLDHADPLVTCEERADLFAVQEVQES